MFAQEVRLRCTEAMLLSLDRPSRMAYLLGDVFHLPGDEAAAVLEESTPRPIASGSGAHESACTNSCAASAGY